MNRRRLVLAGTVCAAMAIAAILLYITSIDERIGGERDEQAASAQVEVKEARLRAPSTDGLTVYLNASDVRAVATLAGVRYLATSGGLIAIDEGGSIKHRYTTLDGLPENDLTALAVFRDRLFVGTASAGLFAFDGNSFTSYSFTKPKATHVSVLVSTEGELLIGTLDGGLFEYDGERFTRRFNSASGADFSRVTALLPLESRLYIGTQASGLYVWREAHIEHINTSEGLPSPHVTALAELPAGFSDDGRVGVATDFGAVALKDSNEMKPITARPNITSLAVAGDRLWAGLFGGGIVDLGADRMGQKSSKGDKPSELSETAGLPRSTRTVVYAGEGSLWALTEEGAFAREAKASGPAFRSVAGSLAGERVLTAGHITSLAFDGAGRLWVGYFDRGIDTVAPQTNERLSHISDDRVREVNFIAFDSDQDRIFVATSRGLVAFDGGLKQAVMTRDESGLISDSIAHISFVNFPSPVSAAGSTMPVGQARTRALVLATAGGLTEILDGRARSITAFHGLASNHLYTSAAVGSRLFAGSLAGLVELEGLRVVRTYKTSNSHLSHDWVTALAEAEGTLYIGTNGGGVDALLPTGEWLSFRDEVGRFEVNQNALHFDGERLYVGTTNRGLLVYNTRARRWSQVTAGLPSQNVTAITSDDGFVYAGTLNGLARIEKRVLN